MDQALREFGKIDILVNCEWLLGDTQGLLMGGQHQTSLLRGLRTPVPGPRLGLGPRGRGPSGDPRSQSTLMAQNSPFKKKKEEMDNLFGRVLDL